MTGWAVLLAYISRPTINQFLNSPNRSAFALLTLSIAGQPRAQRFGDRTNAIIEMLKHT